MHTHALIRSLGCIALVSFITSLRAATGDDFNDNHLDPAKWGEDEKYGHGALTERSQRLEYTCNSGTADDDLIRRWRAGNGPYNADWEMQMDLFNNTSFTPNSVNQNNSYGIKLRGPTDDDQEIFVELYNSQLFGPPMRKGFFSTFETPGAEDIEASGTLITGNAAAVRMTFTASNKVVHVFYDEDPSDGYQWVEFGSFGVAGAGGDTGNRDWQLRASDQFRIYIYGYSTYMTVSAGQMYGDNFQTTGLTGPASVHDLAVTKITAPKILNRKLEGPALVKRVGVTIQNRGAHSEIISTMEQFTNLVSLTVSSLGGACTDITPVFIAGPPQKKLPITLKSKQSFKVWFNVTFGCAVDAAKGAGHEDYRYTAQVYHGALDGLADSHPDCDVCPRLPLAGGVDPNPNGKIKDKGCGAPRGDGTFGNDVLTDVVVK